MAKGRPKYYNETTLETVKSTMMSLPDEDLTRVINIAKAMIRERRRDSLLRLLEKAKKAYKATPSLQNEWLTALIKLRLNQEFSIVPDIGNASLATRVAELYELKKAGGLTISKPRKDQISKYGLNEDIALYVFTYTHYDEFNYGRFMRRS